MTTQDDKLEMFAVTYIKQDNGEWKGEHHLFFHCMAENTDHARQQCMNTNPDCIIISVEWIP